MSADTLLIASQLLVNLLTQAQGVSMLIRKAQTEGRDITDVELDGLAAGDDAARASLDRAIKAARGAA